MGFGLVQFLRLDTESTNHKKIDKVGLIEMKLLCSPKT